MRQNLVPGLLLQFAALTIFSLYTFATPARPWFDAVASVKRQYGYAYSATSTALFGGLVPFAIMIAAGRIERTKRLSWLGFYSVFWLWKGVEIDALYRLQGAIFGNAVTLGVIVSKTFVDQFVYNTIWAAPTQVWFFLWKDSDFSLRALRQQLHVQSLGRRVAVLLVSTWIVWIPTVAVVYALPGPLQVPISNLALCFWCLLLTSISRHEVRLET
jgi:hypothetical protein